MPDLKPLTGTDPAVVKYMNAHETTAEFLKHLFNSLDFLLPQYEKEGKSYVTISDRLHGWSAPFSDDCKRVARHLESLKYRAKVSHRDVEKL